MVERFEICPTDELPPGERTLVQLGNIPVGVFNIDGEYYAVSNHCPHRGGPLCEGDALPAVVAEWKEPGERTEHRVGDDPSIMCPWHGWEFDLESGDHLGDDTITVPTFDVVVEDGELYVDG